MFSYLRASDCRDSDYEDESESDDDSTMDTTSDKQLEHHMPSTKQGSGEWYCRHAGEQWIGYSISGA